MKANTLSLIYHWDIKCLFGINYGFWDKSHESTKKLFMLDALLQAVLRLDQNWSFESFPHDMLLIQAFKACRECDINDLENESSRSCKYWVVWFERQKIINSIHFCIHFNLFLNNVAPFPKYKEKMPHTLISALLYDYGLFLPWVSNTKRNSPIMSIYHLK